MLVRELVQDTPIREPSSFQEFVQRKLLEHQVRLASFVDDANVPIVDAGQARVSGTAAFVEQQVVRLRPRPAVIKAELDRVMCSALLCVWIREQQHMFLHALGFVIDAQQAAVAVRLDQRVAIGRVWLPRLAQILRNEHGAESLVVVAHVEHDRTVAKLGRLAFVPAAEGGLADRPGRAMVATDHDRCERGQRVSTIAAFDRHHQRSIWQVDPLLWRRREQPPQAHSGRHTVGAIHLSEAAESIRRV